MSVRVDTFNIINPHAQSALPSSLVRSLKIPQIMWKSVFYQRPPIAFFTTLKEYSGTSLNFHYTACVSPQALHAQTINPAHHSFTGWIGVLLCVCVWWGSSLNSPTVYTSTSTPGSFDWLETWPTERAVASGSVAYIFRKPSHLGLTDMLVTAQRGGMLDPSFSYL